MICPVCGKPTQNDMIAHRMSQSKANLRKYGSEVVHHPFNLVRVCSLRCNDGVSINAHPLAIARLLASIYEDLALVQRRRVGEP